MFSLKIFLTITSLFSLLSACYRAETYNKLLLRPFIMQHLISSSLLKFLHFRFQVSFHVPSGPLSTFCSFSDESFFLYYIEQKCLILSDQVLVCVRPFLLLHLWRLLRSSLSMIRHQLIPSTRVSSMVLEASSGTKVCRSQVPKCCSVDESLLKTAELCFPRSSLTLSMP